VWQPSKNLVIERFTEWVEEKLGGSHRMVRDVAGAEYWMPRSYIATCCLSMTLFRVFFHSFAYQFPGQESSIFAKDVWQLLGSRLRWPFIRVNFCCAGILLQIPDVVSRVSWSLAGTYCCSGGDGKVTLLEREFAGVGSVLVIWLVRGL